jgi:hypothetical protein
LTPTSINWKTAQFRHADRFPDPLSWRRDWHVLSFLDEKIRMHRLLPPGLFFDAYPH